MYTEPQQSELYKRYMESLHWRVLDLGTSQGFVRSFPLVGGMLKIHRPKKLPDVEKIKDIIQKHRIHTLVIEPVQTQGQQQLNEWCKKIADYVKISTSPFLPSKTIHIDLIRSEEEIFSSFSEAKRRAVRRALKLGVIVTESMAIHDLLAIKNASAGLFGFMTTSGIKELWEIFSPKHASILLAYDKNQKIIGGILLLHYDHISYYWIAGTIKYGKRLFAPTLLVWEAIKLSKKHGSTALDFVGVWDERLPKENLQWQGFTKFKEGFGGEEIYYPLKPGVYINSKLHK